MINIDFFVFHHKFYDASLIVTFSSDNFQSVNVVHKGLKKFHTGWRKSFELWQYQQILKLLNTTCIFILVNSLLPQTITSRRF